MTQLFFDYMLRTLLGTNIRRIRPTNHLPNWPAQVTRCISQGDGPRQEDNQVTVTFVKPDGKSVTVKTHEDKSLYDAVIDNNVDIDGFGACEGTLCCTTCHLIFKQSDYGKIGEPSDEELDMLDLAYGLTDTSRLGCQVILKKELDPLEVEVPASINDVRES